MGDAVPEGLPRLRLPLQAHGPAIPLAPNSEEDVREWLMQALYRLRDSTFDARASGPRDFGNRRLGDGSAQFCDFATQLLAVVKEILKNIHDVSNWTVPSMLALGTQAHETSARVNKIYTHGSPVSAWSPIRRISQLNRLKTMMAILQQWLTLLLAHIDWVGQAGRIAAATSTLSQLTGPSPAVLEHLVNTRAALNVIQFNAEQTSTPNITTELQMGDLLETAVSVMHWTTMKISRGDTDDDTSALQAVNMMLQSKLSTGFGRIHQSLRDINHCFDRLTADLVWEEQVPETIDAIQAAADRTDRSLEHEDSNLWSNAPLGQDNLDSYLQQVGAPDTQFSQLQDATGQPSPFLQACTERGDNFRGILFWCFMLSLFVVFYFPAIRSFRWFVGFFLVFFCMALASAGAKTDEQSKREFFSSALLASWEGRVHDSGVAGAGWYRRLGAEM